MAQLPSSVLDFNPDRIFATVAGMPFRTQADLQRHTQAMLERYQIGQLAEPVDFFFLLQLLTRHPDAAVKIGPGVALFQKRLNLFRGTIPAPGWWIIRVDGSEKSFSIYECFRDRPPSPEQRFLQDVISACRSTIDATVHGLKIERFGGGKMIRCEDSGALISFTEAQVDHGGEWPFIRIVDEWLNERAPWFWQIRVRKHAAGTVRFADPRIDDDFLAFHDARAVLRLVHKTRNASIGSGGYRLTFKVPPRSVAA